MKKLAILLILIIVGITGSALSENQCEEVSVFESKAVNTQAPADEGQTQSTQSPVIENNENATEFPAPKNSEKSVDKPASTPKEKLSIETKDFDYIKQNDKLVIIAYKGNAKKVSIPSDIDGVPVSYIADGAFSKSSIEEIELPEDIVYIGNAAFQDCKNLSYINLPSSIKSIGDAAFDKCDNIIAFVTEYSFAYGYCIQENIQYQCISEY